MILDDLATGKESAQTLKRMICLNLITETEPDLQNNIKMILLHFLISQFSLSTSGSVV